jgi:predicted transcriptional regulator
MLKKFNMLRIILNIWVKNADKEEITMFGLGKPRSKLGKFISQRGISIVEFAEETGVSRTTLGKACADQEFVPSPGVMKKILNAIRKVDPNAKIEDFWRI